ncbi:hypothetical protein LWI29_038511 [Acer saccharum]|uniref:Transmembrane protein n=1 Tax=Acer saccharum TaxID=4024 RepID=A0AA39W1V4_ACESA|nr:hypothetical protein LWI29_038511 [Acer saccharum]KAK1572642.1 hypothetical protein Q3G72_035628 [Acer saccharum]
MASSTQRLLFGFTIIIGILSISVAARPCKTLFISSYSYYSFNPRNPNPNPNPNLNNPSSTTGFVTIFTEIRQFNPRRPEFLFDGPGFPAVAVEIEEEQQPRIRPSQQRSIFGYGGYDFSSLRDRTKDILSVVVALLFGVGCGALTAVTMYLVWTLFASRYDYRNYGEFSDGDDDDNDEDDVFSPKKMGYEKIPAKDAA